MTSTTEYHRVPEFYQNLKSYINFNFVIFIQLYIIYIIIMVQGVAIYSQFCILVILLQNQM